MTELIFPVIKHDCIIHMKQTIGQEKKLIYLDDRASSFTKSNTNII